MTRLTQPGDEIDRVIAGGYCVGCGVCGAVAPQSFRISVDQIGRRQAVRIGHLADPAAQARANVACPFTSAGPDEDTIAGALYGQHGRRHEAFGHYIDLFAGHVREGHFRESGSSGGLAGWLAAELLRRGLVDAVLSVGANPQGYGFGYSVSRSVPEAERQRKTRYYPVTLDEALGDALQSERMAVVGLPCFIKSLRRLAASDEALKSRLAFTISLVCGHLKTDAFGKLLAWQLGVHPDELADIDFRHKLPDRPASSYGVRVHSRTGVEKIAPMAGLVGANWGHGLLKYEACDYCDDVFGETADVSIGDAWLGRYEADARGTNVVVVRSAAVGEILRQALADGRIALDPLSEQDMALSQAGGLRHRRDGLRYRLALKAEAGAWVPVKRVAPQVDHLSDKARRVQRLRLAVRDRGHQLFAQALAANDLRLFVGGMAGDLAELDTLQRATMSVRLRSLALRMLRRARRLAGGLSNWIQSHRANA